MGNKRFIQGLDLEIARGKAAFERGRKDTVLAPYSDVGAVVAALAAPERARGELITTLIGRTRGLDSPAFWRAVLMRVFVPVIERVGRARPGEAADNRQHAAVAFLGAVNAFNAERHGAHAGVYLLGKTRQLFHKRARRERGRETPVVIKDDDGVDDEPKGRGTALALGASDLSEVLVLRDVLLGSPGGVEVLRLMHATLGEEQSFREYVRARHGVLTHADEERQVVRLQRARHRATERARAAICAWRDLTAPFAAAA